MGIVYNILFGSGGVKVGCEGGEEESKEKKKGTAHSYGHVYVY